MPALAGGRAVNPGARADPPSVRARGAAHDVPSAVSPPRRSSSITPLPPSVHPRRSSSITPLPPSTPRLGRRIQSIPGPSRPPYDHHVYGAGNPGPRERLQTTACPRGISARQRGRVVTRRRVPGAFRRPVNLTGMRGSTAGGGTAGGGTAAGTARQAPPGRRHRGMRGSTAAGTARQAPPVRRSPACVSVDRITARPAVATGRGTDHPGRPRRATINAPECWRSRWNSPTS